MYEILKMDGIHSILNIAEEKISKLEFTPIKII